jgi:hypothetical protein
MSAMLLIFFGALWSGLLDMCHTIFGA